MGLVILPDSNDYCKPFVNKLGATKGKSGFVSVDVYCICNTRQWKIFFSPFRKPKFWGVEVCEKDDRDSSSLFLRKLCNATLSGEETLQGLYLWRLHINPCLQGEL
jgi:hypothetical protein